MATTDEIDLPPPAPRAWRFIPEEKPQRPRRQRRPRAANHPLSRIGAWLGGPWRRLRGNLADEQTRWSTVAALAAVLGTLGVLAFWAHLVWSLPSMDDLREARYAQATILYTRFIDNERPDEIEVTRYPSENREWVVLDSISPYVVKALIDTEDRRFREHSGVDVKRLLSSTFKTLTGDTQGGSTITMQFTRNRFSDLTKDGSLTRKFKEWILSYVMEGLHSKNAILEMYLNEVPFLYNAYGVEQASKTYFNKSAVNLTVDEAATLVGMLKATSLYNPVPRDSLPEDLYDIRRPMRLSQVPRSMERRNTVLRLMNAAGDLSADSLAMLEARPTRLAFKPQAREDRVAPFFVDAARREFEAWARSKGIENLNTAGYRVYTTLDPQMQAAAQEALRRQGNTLQRSADRQWSTYDVSDTTSTGAPVRTTVNPMKQVVRRHPELLTQFIRQSSEYGDLVRSGLSGDSAFAQLKADVVFVDTLLNRMRRVEAGFVAMEPESRKVRAYVGGRGFGDKQFDHVGTARRQPGSTFKPFVYAAALASKKFTPSSPIRDAYSCREGNGRTWRPTSGGSNGGTFAVRDALKYSKNAASVNLMMSIGNRATQCSGGTGPHIAAEVARAAGLTVPASCEVPTLALGVCEQTLLQMTNGYATLADYGVYRKPRFIERIYDRDGTLVADFDQIVANPPVEAIDPIVSFEVLNMMRGVISGGTGRALNGYGLGRLDVAGKTGTTQHGSDGWFMAVTPDLAMGAWVGFDSPSISWKSGDLQQGSRTALPIIGQFIQTIRRSEAEVFDETHRFEKPRPKPKPNAPRDSTRREAPAKTREQLDQERRTREARRARERAAQEAAPEAAPPAEITPIEPVPVAPVEPRPVDRTPEPPRQEPEPRPATPAPPKEKAPAPPAGGTPPAGGNAPRPAGGAPPAGGTPPGGNQ